MTSRRASLPKADELFRKTAPTPASSDLEISPQVDLSTAFQPAAPVKRSPRHEEKVTFYCTPGDLDRLERARLELRTESRVVADRGRIVRAALEEILEDFEARGKNSLLVRRLLSPEA